MKIDIESFPQVNHFEYVPFDSEKLLKLKETAFRKFRMCPMSYHLNKECILLNFKKYMWCQHGYTDHPAYKIPLGYSFMILPMVGDPERVKREMNFRDPQVSIKNLLNSPDINCDSCESLNSTCKDKMILNGYIWCIHGLTNKPTQPVSHKEIAEWNTGNDRAEVALNRQPIEETIVSDSALTEELKPQIYRICKHNYVNGKNPKSNLTQVCPIGNAPCDVHCHMGLCLKTVLHISDCARKRCGYDWQKTPEAINVCKTKIFIGQQYPATVTPRANEEIEENEMYYENWNSSAARKIKGLKQALRKSNNKLKGMKEAKHQKRRNRRESKAKRTVPQKLNKDPYVAGAIHTDPEVLSKSILKRHNERYPYNTTADTISDIY